MSVTDTWMIALASLVALATFPACPGAADDDDSAPMDDDDVTDDDDAADDDDSAEPPDPALVLQSISVDCVDEVVGARDQTSTWTVTASFEPGWATDLVLMIWDGEATDGFHYFDPWQPFVYTGDENTDFGAGGSYDEWTKTLRGFSTTTEAEADGGTLFSCYDDVGAEQVSTFEFMLCASDFHYEGSAECWFVGDDLGQPAGTAAAPDGAVGELDDQVASQTWEPDAADSPFIFSSSNPD